MMIQHFWFCTGFQLFVFVKYDKIVKKSMNNRFKQQCYVRNVHFKVSLKYLEWENDKDITG